MDEAKSAFAQGGLNTNKQLKNYDCWEEDKSPEEWVAECRRREPPHAKCPIYSRQYVWTHVEVLGWDEGH